MGAEETAKSTRFKPMLKLLLNIFRVKSGKNYLQILKMEVKAGILFCIGWQNILIQCFQHKRSNTVKL